ncbi:MAG TPA: MBL fold metallo-hydrolase [Flavisolibacter sp.]|jgi:L-ascorbate metabolism protein UlaG (beta-lactamase superfamily)|nr:MBL fold metallo-hydrolase [Flavisolibacter sp.]
MFIVLAIVFVLVWGIYLFMQQPPFGKAPDSKTRQQLQLSPQYRDQQFQNEHDTPNLAEGVSYMKVFKDFFFHKSKRNRPSVTLPSQKTELRHLDPALNLLVWFGHSSYFIQADGKTFLVDPVFSGHASPVNFTTKSFPGTDQYQPEDFPAIDYLVISHDHWDHLDYRTVTALKSKVGQVITGLGVGSHLIRWGFGKEQILERDWNQTIALPGGFQFITAPARHFSGRGLKRNQTLWSSFILQTPSLNLYLGGDSGYDTHFKQIGEEYGPFDLAILECGQYNPYWKYIHMMPEEVVQAATNLKAATLLPVHWAKFALSLHAWDEPIKRVMAEAERKNLPILHPMIGEQVLLKGTNLFTRWWESVESVSETKAST